jgi:hypothetical protein
LLFVHDTASVIPLPDPGETLSDPFQRLQRAPIGAHLMGLTDLVLRVHARTDRPVPEPPVLTGGERKTFALGVRRPRRVAQTEPNAPQLIRIVKTPYALSPAWARRRRVRDARERLPPIAPFDPVAVACEAARRPVFACPAGQRPRGAFPSVPRGMVARYLAGLDADGGTP